MSDMYVIIRTLAEGLTPTDHVVIVDEDGQSPFGSFEDAWEHGDAFVPGPWSIAKLDFSEWPDDPE